MDGLRPALFVNRCKHELSFTNSELRLFMNREYGNLTLVDHGLGMLRFK